MGQNLGSQESIGRLELKKLPGAMRTTLGHKLSGAAGANQHLSGMEAWIQGPSESLEPWELSGTAGSGRHHAESGAWFMVAHQQPSPQSSLGPQDVSGLLKEAGSGVSQGPGSQEPT